MPNNKKPNHNTSTPLTIQRSQNAYGCPVFDGADIGFDLGMLLLCDDEVSAEGIEDFSEAAGGD
ncbi:hypothetical protein, partial [Bifidobacterium psychraerophilum]|uniref:hypothetical protein n=1 Tax=Bifidobacterium psychraerophilum TaxID=218140 RepID=UPI003340BFCE